MIVENISTIPIFCSKAHPTEIAIGQQATILDALRSDPEVDGLITNGVLAVISFDTSALSGVAQEELYPSGLPATRPATPPVGYSFFNTSTGIPNYWDGSGWIDAAGGAA